MYEIHLRKVGKWGFVIVNPHVRKSRRTILVSQDYATKFSARRTAKRLAAVNHFPYKEL